MYNLLIICYRLLQVVTAIATSHYSGRIFQKLGFSCLQETAYTEYKVGGEVVFPTAEPHTHVRLFIKRV